MLCHRHARTEIDRQRFLTRISHRSEPVIAMQTRPTAAPRGTVTMRTLYNDLSQSYFLYWPERAIAAAPVLVTVHGISRNALEQITAFTELAERCGAVLMAPLFKKSDFRDYQRLGRWGRRADHMLDHILAEVRRLTAAHTEQVHLFGYSGGAQFVHRYAMAYPGRVKSAAVAAAGWYTFPDPTQNYPYGIRPTTESLDLGFEPERFLQVSMHVWVGECDILRDASLRQSKRVDQQQGLNRVERARCWVDAMRVAAQHANLDTPYSMTLLPDSNHSFRRCIKRGQLAKRVFAALFDSENSSDTF